MRAEWILVTSLDTDQSLCVIFLTPSAYRVLVSEFGVKAAVIDLIWK